MIFKDHLFGIFDLFPFIAEKLRLERVCRAIGLAAYLIKRLLNNESDPLIGKIYSSDHKQKIDAIGTITKIESCPLPDNPHRLRLKLDGIGITEWLREKIKGMRGEWWQIKKKTDKSLRFDI